MPPALVGEKMPTAIYPMESVRGDRHTPATLSAATLITFQPPPQPDAATFGARSLYIHAMVGGYVANIPAYATSAGRLLGVMFQFQSVSNTGNGITQCLASADAGGVTGSTTAQTVTVVPINLNFGFPGLRMNKTNDNTYSCSVDIVYLAGTGALTGTWQINPAGTLKFGGGSWATDAASGLAISCSFGS